MQELGRWVRKELGRPIDGQGDGCEGARLTAIWLGKMAERRVLQVQEM